MSAQAFLDVSDILVDPEIACSFVVYRRAEDVGQNGRAGIGSKPFNALGVVTVAHGNDLLRLPEEQRMDRHITIVTRTMLQGPSEGVQPDAIGWAGSYYVVKTIDPYPQYGAGFIQAIAGSMDNMDPPPAFASVAGESFGGESDDPATNPGGDSDA